METLGEIRHGEPSAGLSVIHLTVVVGWEYMMQCRVNIPHVLFDASNARKSIDIGIELKNEAVRFWIIASSLISLLMSADAAHAEKRVAFVVGNGAYDVVAQLSSPPIDAIAMATTLRDIGFEVVEGTNLTRDKMTERFSTTSTAMPRRWPRCW